MEEEKKKQIAAFRFGVIHDLVGHVALEPGEQERLIREKCGRKWVIPFSEKTYISRSTILRWVKLYKDSGGRLQSLCTQDRSDQGMSRAMDQETSLALMRLRKELPKATVPRLISEMNKRRLVSPGVTLNASTLYRFLHGHDLMQLTTPVPEDRRRFEVELPNDLWQVECMLGPRVALEGNQSETISCLHGRSFTACATRGILSFRIGQIVSYCFARGSYEPRASQEDLFGQRPGIPLTSCGAYGGLLGIALIHARPYKNGFMRRPSPWNQAESAMTC